MAYGTFVSEMPQYRLHPVLAAGREIYREADHAILVDRLAYLHGVGEARAVQRLAQTLRRILRILQADHAKARSEEHTSELQSLMRTSYAVCCVNKKTKHTTVTTT